MARPHFFPNLKECDINKNNDNTNNYEYSNSIDTLAVISSHAFTFLGIAVSIGLLCRPLLKLTAMFLPFICAYHASPLENTNSPTPKL